MVDSVGIYAFSRQLRRRVAAAGDGTPPVLITRHDRSVALLVSVEVGLQTAGSSVSAQVGMTGLMSQLSRVLGAVQQERQAVVITNHSRPVAMLVPAEGAVMEDYRRARQNHLDELLGELRQAPGPSLDEILRQARGPTLDEILRQLRQARGPTLDEILRQLRGTAESGPG